MNGFDTTDAESALGRRQAAYAKSPIPQIPVSAFNVLGGLSFASPGNNAVYQNNSHIVSPRAGFAWTPDAFNGKTVIPRSIRHVRRARDHREPGHHRQLLHQPGNQPAGLQPVHHHLRARAAAW